MNNSVASLSGPVLLNITSYVSRAFKCTPDGRAGCMHCANRFDIFIRLGMTWYCVFPDIAYGYKIK